MLSHYLVTKIAHFGLLLSSYVHTGLLLIALSLQTVVTDRASYSHKNATVLVVYSDSQIQIKVENKFSN